MGGTNSWPLSASAWAEPLEEEECTFLEKMQWRKEKWYRRLLNYLHSTPRDEPFHFLSRGRKMFDFVSILILITLAGATCTWQFNAGVERRDALAKVWVEQHNSNATHPLAQCVLPTATHRVLMEFFICIAITTTLHIGILLLSSVRCQLVFPLRRLNFKWRRKLPPVAASAKRYEITTKPFQLAPTCRSLRECVAQVRLGSVPLDAPTRFLLSVRGRTFLNQACARLHDNLQLYDDELVRRNRRGTWTFFLISLICVTVSMAAAYEDPNVALNCSFRKLVLSFLERFSFTLLAAFAVASFAGVSHYNQLICVRERLHRLTDDERFLMSLIAANTTAPFRGVAPSFTSGYARLIEPGDTKVFQAIHASLFAYKMARTAQTGSTRMYNIQANDCFENYDMT